jgi:uncharacterized protein (DUF2461 family)
MVSAVSAFRGFPPEAIEFLRELEANNDRDWFKANRARYDEHLIAPATALSRDLRQAVDEGRTAASLTRAIGRAEDAGLELNAPDLVRAPRGYPADHPRVDLLRRRGLTVARRHDIGPWLHRPEAGTRIREELQAAVPLARWLRTNVGITQSATVRTG